ncbi:MAG: hypothetical protein ABIT83_25580 [Massilia sp.]
MSTQHLYAEPQQAQQQSITHRRRQRASVDSLILSELNPLAVLDHAGTEGQPISLMSFGGVRETCPKCEQAQLRLILRQESVRTPHLFCAECQSCFDARYPNGASALAL